MNNPKIIAKSYTLKNEKGNLLGQVVLTSDGMFAAVTDWGNFSFAWRAIGDEIFEEFLLRLRVDYFANKMVQGFSYICHNRKIDNGAKTFADKILPALQRVLEEDKKNSKIEGNED